MSHGALPRANAALKEIREPLKIRFAVVPAEPQFVIGLISRHLRGGLKAIVPAGTEFLEALIRK